MNIVISNTAALNGGDAAILHATIGVLRKTFGEAIEVTAADMQAEAAARYHPDVRFCPSLYGAVTAWAGAGARRKAALLLVLAAALGRGALGRRARRLLPDPVRRPLDAYARADVVVSAGGTYLVPHYHLAPKLYDFLVTLALGRPLVLFTQSLGPFDGLRQRRLLRFALRRARLILVRDERSVGHLRALGIAANVRVAADAAFALARDPPAARRPDRLKHAPNVAISVRDWPHFGRGAAAGMDGYCAAMATFAAELARWRGAQVTFVSTCQGIPEYWTDDSAVAERIAALVPADVRGRIRVDREFRTPARLIERFAGFDAVVATRMHAAILALCAGTPVLAVAYEFKTRQLFARLGLDEFTLDVETLTGDRLIDAWERFEAALERIDGVLWPAVAREQRSALAVTMPLAELLGQAPVGLSAERGDGRAAMAAPARVGVHGERAEGDGGARRAQRRGAPEAAQQEREADADDVEGGRRDDEARGIAERRGGGRQLEPVGVAVKDREHCDDRDRRGERQGGAPGDRQAQHQHRGENAALDAGQRDTAQRCRGAGDHGEHEGAGQRPSRAAAELRRPQADRDHRQHMVEAAERMQEALGRAGAPRAEAVRRGRFDAGRHDDGEDEGKLTHQGALLFSGPDFSGPSLGARRHEAARAHDEVHDFGDAAVFLEVGEMERPRAAHLPRVAVHDVEIGADQRRQVDLVYDEQVRARDAGPALARDLVAGRDVDDVDRDVGELRAERRRQVVAARFDEDQVELPEAPAHVVDRREVDRGVLADRGVRATAGLDAHDALRGERARAGQELRVLLGIDVVGHDRDLVLRAHVLAQAIDQGRLARADGPADADAERVARCAGHAVPPPRTSAP
jgi:colanic acid/amylovoran biosynthesis protein